MSNLRVKTNEGWLFVGDRLAAITPEGALCGLPLVGGTKYADTPQSPIYFDNGAHLRGIDVDCSGVYNVRFWRSLGVWDPDNQDDIEAAVTAGDPIPQPTFGPSKKWIQLTGLRGHAFFAGISPVPSEIIQEAKKGRWLKVDPLPGQDDNSIQFHPVIAGF